MKFNDEFGFLPKDCPLVSRELVRPWRLAALAVGLGILVAGSHLTPSADWDYPVSFIMGVCAYVCAPWTVRALVYRRWKFLPLAFALMWVSIDGVYSLYWWCREFDALQTFRGANALYCLPLYFTLGFAMNVALARREGSRLSADVPLRGSFAFRRKHLLHVVVTGFLLFAFAGCLLLTTGGLRQIGF